MIGGGGPGEFSGRQPYVGESGGRIYTVSQFGHAATWSRGGELLGAKRYEEFITDHPGSRTPIGMLRDGTLVVHFFERPIGLETGTHELRQGFRAYSPAEGLVWEYDELPPAVGEIQRTGGGSRGEIRTVFGEARHETIAIFKNGERWLRVLDGQGKPRGQVELPYEAFSVLIDADERVWVQVWARNEKRTGSYLVLDADLAPLMRVTERNVLDARGDRLLTTDTDSLGVRRFYLLERRRE